MVPRAPLAANLTQVLVSTFVLLLHFTDRGGSAVFILQGKPFITSSSSCMTLITRAPTVVTGSYTTDIRRVSEPYRASLKLKHLVPQLRARDRLRLTYLVMEDTILNADSSNIKHTLYHYFCSCTTIKRLSLSESALTSSIYGGNITSSLAHDAGVPVA
ncbi:hypothetical protein EDD22DRAFT_490103 [Suillus occidentalis]|nr:hypothetical protein EDD22DRAFT_490103 [Suillus occidentalis]